MIARRPSKSSACLASSLKFDFTFEFRIHVSVGVSRDAVLDVGFGDNLYTSQRQSALTPDLGSTTNWGIEDHAHSLAVHSFDDRGLSADVLGPQVLGLDDCSNIQFVGGSSFHPTLTGLFDPA